MYKNLILTFDKIILDVFFFLNLGKLEMVYLEPPSISQNTIFKYTAYLPMTPKFNLDFLRGIQLHINC